MSAIVLAVLAVTAAYLIGAIPFGYLIFYWARGIDIRTVGSGNIGATNAGRLLGRKWAVVIYFLDFAKGFVPVVVLRRAFGDPAGPATVPVSIVAGLSAAVAVSPLTPGSVSVTSR